MKKRKIDIILLITEFIILKVLAGTVSLTIIENLEKFRGLGLPSIIAFYGVITLRMLTRYHETFNQRK